MKASRFLNPDNLIIESVAGEGPLNPEALLLDFIRSRFTHPPMWTPEIQAEPPLKTAPAEPMLSSVMVPIVNREEGPTVLFTRRPDHLKAHPGQISFPGGRAEEGDASPIETALREAEEEIGLSREYVDVIGTLPEAKIATGFHITPVVCVIDHEAQFTAAPDEVAEIFEIPLSYLMNGHHHERRYGEFPYGLGMRRFYVMPYKHYFVWGATAGMLRNLFLLLRAK